MITVDPATLLDMAALLGHSRFHWRMARQMHAGGDTFAFRDGKTLLAIAGLYPGPDPAIAEGWFCPVTPQTAVAGLALPAGRASDLIRAMRFTVRRSPYRAILTVCASEAGRRVARAIGFTYCETTPAGEVWCYDGSAETIRDRRGRRRGGSGGEPAAADAR